MQQVGSDKMEELQKKGEANQGGMKQESETEERLFTMLYAQG